MHPGGVGLVVQLQVQVSAKCPLVTTRPLSLLIVYRRGEHRISYYRTPTPFKTLKEVWWKIFSVQLRHKKIFSSWFVLSNPWAVVDITWDTLTLMSIGCPLILSSTNVSVSICLLVSHLVSITVSDNIAPWSAICVCLLARGRPLCVTGEAALTVTLQSAASHHPALSLWPLAGPRSASGGAVIQQHTPPPTVKCQNYKKYIFLTEIRVLSFLAN